MVQNQVVDWKPFEKKLWLSSPTMHEEEKKFVQKAFDTNWVSTVGENLDQLEKTACEYVGCKYAVALSAGTAALHLAVKLAGLKSGEKVFCSDMTFAATVNPITYENGVQIFIDSERDTWNMDPLALEKAFLRYPDVRIVVIANLYGTPSKFNEIKEICNKHKAIIIEDAAESLGATYKGKQTGTFGKYNVISYNGNKIITCSGGGMLLTDDKVAADKARKWSTQARECTSWYQHEQLGYNYRMSNVLAGIGRGQYLHLEEHIAQKKAIYMRYKEGFQDISVSMNPYISEIMEPNFWMSCILVDSDAMCRQVRDDKDALYVKESGKSCPTEILEKLAKYNAEGRPIWKPMHMQPIYRKNEFIKLNQKDVSSDIFARGLCLPSDIKMTEEQQDRVIDIVRSCFN